MNSGKIKTAKFLYWATALMLPLTFTLFDSNKIECSSCFQDVFRYTLACYGYFQWVFIGYGLITNNLAKMTMAAFGFGSFLFPFLFFATYNH